MQYDFVLTDNDVISGYIHCKMDLLLVLLSIYLLRFALKYIVVGLLTQHIL